MYLKLPEVHVTTRSHFEEKTLHKQGDKFTESVKNLINTQYFSQLHAFEYEYEYSGLLFQYIVTIMKSMHDSGKKWNGKTTENYLFHYLYMKFNHT